MFNFKYQCDMTTWQYHEEAHGFVVRAREEIKAGEEIFVYYGNKPNANFFQFYGFVLENNACDVIQLKVDFSTVDPLGALKAELLDKPNKRFRKVTEATEDNKFSKAMSLLRYVVFNGTAEELKEVRSPGKAMR